jgi:hypothetical protein
MDFVLLVEAYKKKGHKTYNYGNSMSPSSSKSVTRSNYYMALVNAIIENVQCVYALSTLHPPRFLLF